MRFLKGDKKTRPNCKDRLTSTRILISSAFQSLFKLSFIIGIVLPFFTKKREVSVMDVNGYGMDRVESFSYPYSNLIRYVLAFLISYPYQLKDKKTNNA